jgi:hypothetical protein
MPLIFRLVKGAPVTFLEGDDNLRYLEGLAISSSINFNNWTGSALSQFAGTASLALTASYALNAGSGLSGGTQYYLPVWTGASTLGTSSLYDDSSVLKSVYNGNDVGLKLDFEVGSYILGETNHNISIYSGSEETYIINKYIEQSDPSGTNKFIVDGFNNVIKTQYQNNDIGLKLDFANQIYTLGRSSDKLGFTAQFIDGKFYVGDVDTNQNYLLIDSGDGIYKTVYGGNETGFNLNVGDSIYQLGQLTGGNQTKLIIDDPTNTISITGSLIAPSITGSLFGTSSWAVSASWAPSSTLSTTFISTGSVSASVNTTGNIFTVASSSVNLMSVSSSGMVTVATSGSNINMRLYIAGGIYPVIETLGNNEILLKTNNQDRLKVADNVTTNVPLRFGTPPGGVTVPLIRPGTGIRFIDMQLVAGLSGSVRGDILIQSGSLIAQGGGFSVTTGSTSYINVFPSNGNVFVGSTPVDGGFKLDVNGTTRLQNTLTVNGSGNVFTVANNSGTTFFRVADTGITETLGASVGNYSLVVNSNAASGGSFGLSVVAGTNTSDNAIRVRNKANTANLLVVRGDGTTFTNNLEASGSGRFTDGLTVTGSATITNVLTLPYQDPLPSSPATGSIALSGSGATFVGMFVWTGVWTQI